LKQRAKKWCSISAPYLLAAVIAGWTGCGYAAGFFNFQDTEKPKPEFTRKGDVIAAKLIPRAKSTSVELRFAVPAGGRLMDVLGIDFQAVDRPEVDVKNFKSAAFEIHIDHVASGGEAEVSIASDFFTASTAFYAFNPRLETPWMDTQAKNLPHPDNIQELLITVKDGGPMDADGTADGRITLIGGPRDSFWGYALGTLFIRFFGIFIVLTVLMIGMILSGLFFKLYNRPKRGGGGTAGSTPERPGAVAGGPAPVEQTFEATQEEVAAIATALHIHFKQARGSVGAATAVMGTGGQNAWAAEGRKRVMYDRLSVFNRFHRSDR
jgi:hypothetical protein